MDLQEFNGKVNQLFGSLSTQVSFFSNFIISKLKNFPNLSIGEQISYPAVALGFILILVSVILFLL